MKKIYHVLFIFSVVTTVIAGGMFALWGLQLGIDFTGGTVMEVRFQDGRPDTEIVKGILFTLFPSQESIVTLSGESDVIMKLGELTEVQHQQVLVALREAFPDAGVSELRFDSIGPTIGNELREKSVTGLIIVMVGVVIYIAIVFRALSATLSPWAMGVSAIGAMVHDALIPLGVFAYLSKFHHVEISAVFVAAILTVIGYSISDSVVVFDRLRENIIRFGRKESFATLIHKSVLQTLTRSLNTTFTTMLPLIAIYVFGGATLQYFALALLIGIFLGSYSSIFVAAPVLYYWTRWQKGSW